MKLNELLKKMYGVRVIFIDCDTNECIYKGNTLNLKKNKQEFKKYEVVNILRNYKEDIDLSIVVKEVK